MGKPRLEYCTIDSIDVSSYLITWKVTREQSGSISTVQAKFNFKILDVIDFDVINSHHTIEIWRGISAGNETRIFKGEVYTFDKLGAALVCNCKCELYKAVRMQHTYSYDKDIDSEAGKFSEIFISLMTLAGLTADSSSVQDSGTVHVISKFICNHADIFERCDKLAEAVDNQFYYNPSTDKAYFEPSGYVNASVILEVGVNVINKPDWKFDKTSLCNKYTIIGGEELIQTDEFFSGNGSNLVFTLANTPESVRVETPVGTLKTGGNEATTGTYHYIVDKENKQIVFTAGNAPGAGASNVKITYNYTKSRNAVAKDDTSITTNGTFEKSIFASELKHVDDVKIYARQFVKAYKDPFLSTRLDAIDITDVFPGQSIRVIDYKHGYTTTPDLIAELSSILVAIRCYVNLSGGSYDDATSYTLGSKAVTIGEVYVNIREVIDQFKKRKQEILDAYGHRASLCAI